MKFLKGNGRRRLLCGLLALLLGRNRRLSRSEGAELAAEIETIPALIRDVLSRAPAIKQIAERYAKFEDFF